MSVEMCAREERQFNSFSTLDMNFILAQGDGWRKILIMQNFYIQDSMIANLTELPVGDGLMTNRQSHSGISKC